MSGGKKKKPKSKMYSESEVRRMVHKCNDEAVKKIMLLCVTAARDEFDMDEDKLVTFMGRMQRYVDNEAAGLFKLDVANESLKKHGIDLKLARW